MIFPFLSAYCRCIGCPLFVLSENKVCNNEKQQLGNIWTYCICYLKAIKFV